MNFKELLKEVDMSGAQLARRVGVSRSAVSSWVIGKTSPNFDKIYAIAKALGVSVERVIQCFVHKDEKENA